MNKDKARPIFAEKIVDFESWKTACNKAGIYYDELPGGLQLPNCQAMSYGGMSYVGHWRSLGVNNDWWMRRELIRQHVGVYPETTEVLRHLAASFHYVGLMFPHISREDPNSIAYTASMEDGLRDKQVRTSIGKFLRRFLLLATDTHIQQLEASHRAELDPSFPVATTEEEIVRVYRNMLGDSGCMRHAPDYWDLPANVHPSMVYNAPGVGVAYLQDVSGNVKSRSVVYDNPEDPADKRYVRIYGDPALKRKLERSGYRMASLQGVKLRLLDLRKSHPSRYGKSTAKPYVLPYLDGPGGNQEDRSGCHAYILKGEQAVRLINQEQTVRLATLGYFAPRVKSTDVNYALPEVDSEKLEITDALTGEKFNSLDHDTTQVWHEGKLGLTKEDSDWSGWTSMYVLEPNGRGRVSVMVKQEERDRVAFLDDKFTGNWCIDTPEMRRNLKYFPLEPATYGENKWGWNKEVVEATPGAGVYYLKKDCSIVFDEHGTQRWVPAPQVEEYKKSKDYVAVAPRGEEKALSHKANPNLVMTLGKRRCVQGWHGVIQLYDGSWDYAQNARAFTMLGQTLYYSTKEGDRRPEQPVVSEAVWRKVYLNDVIDYATQYVEHPNARLDYVKRQMFDGLRDGTDGFFFWLRAGVVFRGFSGDIPRGLTFDAIRQAVEKLAAMSDEEITDTLDASFVPIARTFQLNAAVWFKVLDEANAKWSGEPASPAAEAAQAAIDELLTATAVHIRDERFSQAA